MVKEATELEKMNKGIAEEISLDGFDYIEFFVGNALQACYYYHRGFGFDLVGYRGLETGNRDTVSYVLRQDHVNIVLTSPIRADHEINDHLAKHGDGVKNIAMRTRDCQKAYDTAIARGAISVQEPTTVKDENGIYRSAAIKTYGDTIHTFVERGDYKGLAPGFKPVTGKDGLGVGLVSVDHIVGNVEVDHLAKWVDFYKQIFGFHVYQYFDPEDISTKYSALVSKVMSNKSGSVKLPINEPFEMGLRKSQISEYLDYYNAPGVQHIAITTRDIIATVKEMKSRGIEFLGTPSSYYATLSERVGKIDEDMAALQAQGILVDKDDDGYLLQIFTKPVQDRPTLFFEVIQRKGCKGFGKGNFQALFESIEREQENRGNL